MKCPKCGGNAKLSNWGSYIDPDYADYHVECEKCGYHSMGSTDPQKAKEMFEKGMGMHYTNEEWLRQANTEQLAELFVGVARDGADALKRCNGSFEPLNIYKHEFWVVWLKQPHTNE